MQHLTSMIIEFNLFSHTYTQVSIENWHSDPQKIYWVHCNLSQPDTLTTVAEKISLPAWLVESCKEMGNFRRFSDSSNYLVLQIPCPLHDKPDATLEIENVIICLKDNYCFTACLANPPALINVLENIQVNINYILTTGFMIFLIIDNAINSFSSFLEEYENIADTLEIQIREAKGGTYSQVMGVKKQVTKVKRHLLTIRDILMRISGRKIAMISEPCRKSLDTLLAHSQALISEVDAIRDVLNGSLELIDNSLMQKMNNTMKILMGLSAIFLPLSLIAAIYGMNFRWMPELEWKYGYFYVLSFMGLMAISLIILLKKKKWFE